MPTTPKPASRYKMKIDYVIMSHPSREQYAEELFLQLLDQNINYLAIETDRENLGVWENAKHAWLRPAVKPGANYRIVIQDDAILCDNFIQKAETFIEQHAGHVISFYYGDNPQAHKEIKPDYFDTMLNHAVCLAIPTAEIEDMIQYCDFQPECTGDDMKIRRWLITNGRTCRYSNPSLVQHRDIPSIVDPTKPVRQSKIYKQ